MMRKNEGFKIGDCTFKLVKVEKNFLTLEIIGYENGFKTVFKISKDNFRKMAATVRDAACINSNLVVNEIHGIRVKCREYTRTDHEADFIYKYDESNNATIKVVAIGGHCTISLYDYRVFRTVAFNVNRHRDTFNRMSKAIAEASMYEF